MCEKEKIKTEYEYIRFVEHEWKDPGRKTAKYSCVNKRSEDKIGVVEWYGPWRQFVFAPEYDTVFEPKCLMAICEFLAQLMEARKRK